jgi:predicted DsbA family dithiol-disulfide isomerase
MLSIKIVSDVVCPWCVIGHGNLAIAIESLKAKGIVNEVELTWLPFELNPDMPSEGEQIHEHLTRKYGNQDFSASQAKLVSMGKELNFIFDFNERSRIYNTFNAHLLLQNVSLEQQQQLSALLFTAYFTNGLDISDKQVLTQFAAKVGLSGQEVNVILDDQAMQIELKSQLTQIQQMGITSVPSMIINDQYLISGGQAAEVFEKSLVSIIQNQQTA